MRREKGDKRREMQTGEGGRRENEGEERRTEKGNMRQEKGDGDWRR